MRPPDADHAEDTARRDEFLVFGKPVIGEAEIDEVVKSLRSGWIGTGPKVQRFERMLEEYTGAPHVRCLASCTAALTLGLKSLGIGPGDEVLVPTMTFVASANAVEHTGASPVLVDVEADTGLIDFDAAEAAVSERTAAVMPVHMAGRPVDVDRLSQFAQKHGVAVIEDAAHALGAASNGVRVGNHGNLTAFSFYVTKNITTIEGGAVATADAAIAERIERLGLHGLSLGAWQRFSDAGFKHYEAVEAGFKFNMTDVQAALGLHQLPRLDDWIKAREQAWIRYDNLLADLPVKLPPPATAGTTHARHLYQVQVMAGGDDTRDRLLEGLHARGIGTGVHYRAVHLHPYYREKYELAPDTYPVATQISMRTLSLPLSPELTAQDQSDVADAIRAELAG